MTGPSAADVFKIDPHLELVDTRAGLLVARSSEELAVCEGDLSVVAAVLSEVDGLRNVAEICAALEGRLARESVLNVLAAAAAARWIRPPRDSSGMPFVVIFGGGILAELIAARLEAAKLRCRRVPAPVSAEPPPDAGDAGPGPRRAYRASRVQAGVEGIPEELLAAECAAADVVVSALEGAPFAAAIGIEAAARRAGKPCLHVGGECGQVLVGPTAIPGRSTGFESSRAELIAAAAGVDPSVLWSMTLPRVTARALAVEAAGVASVEVEHILSPDATPALIDSVAAIGPHGASTVALAPGHDAGGPRWPRRDLLIEADITTARAANLERRLDDPRATRIRHVGILGGGTAGYLTALALRRRFPDLPVTVIESSKIPVIGVGEATTALFNHFIHHDAGLDIADFFAEVRPTFKLGIRFEWGLPPDYYFNSPFQFGKLLESVIYDGDVNSNCLASRMMSADRVPVLAGGRSLLSEVPWAYHIDNRRFVGFLKKCANRAGVATKDAVISDVIAANDRSAVEALVTDGGERLTFDLYIDCTGFRSVLLDRALGAPFTSYASSLMTDSAVVADVPHHGRVKVYTTAESMDHGWCWNIPMEDCDHRGYVYCSAFATVEEAAAEMRRKNPGMGDTWTIRFRSGRHDAFWKGNVVAIGNSYAFVEPLQSTAIHMIIVQIQQLLRSFPTEPGRGRFQPVANKRVAEVWDVLRYFLGAHYRFNRRFDTPFWRECRENTDITGIADVVRLYQERAPIGSTPLRFEELDDSTFGVFRHDLLFMGQQLPTTYSAPATSEARWRTIGAAADRVVARSLSHAEAIAVLEKRPELLYQYVAGIRRT